MEAEGSEDITKKALASSLKRRTDRINQIQVDMTGTGINKAKKDEIEIKKERFNKDKDNK
jgi:hypothetical protein